MTMANKGMRNIFTGNIKYLHIFMQLMINSLSGAPTAGCIMKTVLCRHTVQQSLTSLFRNFPQNNSPEMLPFTIIHLAQEE